MAMSQCAGYNRVRKSLCSLDLIARNHEDGCRTAGGGPGAVRAAHLRTVRRFLCEGRQEPARLA